MMHYLHQHLLLALTIAFGNGILVGILYSAWAITHNPDGIRRAIKDI